MRDYDERLMDSFAGDPLGIDKLSDDDFFGVFIAKKGPKRGPGRCTECGKLLEPWQDGWNGMDGQHHLVDYDMGGGNVETLSCGPIFQEEE